MRNLRRTVAVTGMALLAAASFGDVARAQMGTPSMQGGGGQGRNNAPTQSGPVQNRTVGPRAGANANDDEDDAPQVQQRASEPLTAPPADPLEIPPEVKERIGTDADVMPPAPMGEMKRSYFPYYEETKGDYRFRFLPPLYLEYTRGLPTSQTIPGEPSGKDRQSLTALFFYQRRSQEQDRDILFPLAWHVRDRQNQVYVFGPLAHREAPGEHDNWFAPLFFEGERQHGGYFHSPLLLTTSHWSAEKAFELTALYFRDRRGSDVDVGVVPFYFRGDNGNIDGARRTYTLIPPLFYFHRERESDDSKLTVVGPVVLKSTPKRTITDVAPLFFHIEGHPESGGVRESHTTLFPFFHYGYTDDEKHETLFAVPGYVRRTTTTVDTTLTPFFSHSSTRSGATQLYAGGPILPLFWSYTDRDIGQKTYAALPIVYHSHSPRGSDWLTPVFGSFTNYGVSHTYWTFPTLVVSSDKHGWEGDLLPIAFFGRSDKSSHSILAPIFWDFASPKGRTTIGAPLYWRFADATDDSITQVAGNTVYRQKRVPGGLEWEFHVIPLVSYGSVPSGHWWNFLFGLAGYSHDTDGTRTVRALWLPIKIHGADAPAQQAKLRGRDPAYHGARF